MITAKNIFRHELTGLDVRVVQAHNRYLSGISGKIVEETKNMILILTVAGVKQVAKAGSVFRFTLPSGMSVDMMGSVLVMAPEKRINMRLKI
jgi:ribonuclease P protein subunit POP4